MRLLTSAFVATSLLVAAGNAQQQARPSFRDGIDLVTIDVQIAPAKDAPVRVFTADDFEINIAGHKRPVMSLTLLHNDDGPVGRIELAPSSNRDDSTCIFALRRRVNRPSVHYLIGVVSDPAARGQVKQVKVKLLDKAFDVKAYAWRSVVRKADGR